MITLSMGAGIEGKIPPDAFKKEVEWGRAALSSHSMPRSSSSSSSSTSEPPEVGEEALKFPLGGAAPCSKMYFTVGYNSFLAFPKGVNKCCIAVSALKRL